MTIKPHFKITADALCRAARLEGYRADVIFCVQLDTEGRSKAFKEDYPDATGVSDLLVRFASVYANQTRN